MTSIRSVLLSYVLFFLLCFLLIPMTESNLPTRAALAGVPISSFVTCNLNSLSLHQPGGLSGRKQAVINTLKALALAHDVTCIQDVRTGSDDYAAELRSDLPRHHIRFNCNSSTSGGVLTIISPRFPDSSISHHAVIDNHVLQTTISDTSDPLSSITFFNCYLNPTDDDAGWTRQVQLLKNTPFPPNSVLLGDLNHAPEADDRSSDYIDRSDGARSLFRAMLQAKLLFEVPQPMHTFYRFNSVTDSLSSSRIDHVYTNFSFTTLIKHHPEAAIYTSAPNTLCSYRKPPDWSSRSSDLDLEGPVMSIEDRQLIGRYPRVRDGGTHITDHLPISVRFADHSVALSAHTSRIPKAIYNHPDFVPTFCSIWCASNQPTQP